MSTLECQITYGPRKVKHDSRQTILNSVETTESYHCYRNVGPISWPHGIMWRS